MKILVWGREGNYGPDYPRNRVVFEAMRALGHEVDFFRPRLSAVADVEARLRALPVPDVVWVPCFRQRDMAAAARFARRAGVPLVFDPLISAWDKQVHERGKFAPESWRSRRLLARERAQFAGADVVVADTDGHAAFFHEQLQVPRERLVVVPVGAEEALFGVRPLRVRAAGEAPEVIFFGTFIGLHGIETVLDAIALYRGAPVRWRLLGDGPLREVCEARIADFKAGGLDIAREGWRPLAELPARLAEGDLFLGIFGTSAKALRVIPNKVYQALALGRPVVTASTPAYPDALRADEQQGLFWCQPGDARSLADAIARATARRGEWPALAQAARRSYESHFSGSVLQQRVAAALARARELRA